MRHSSVNQTSTGNGNCPSKELISFIALIACKTED